MAKNQLFATKSLDVLRAEAAGDNRLSRVLGPISLTALGVGAIIGTGIFVLVGKAAAQQAGPALMLSFVASGLACVFAALCYAEFAAMAPVAGSAYTYAYATLGELFAWIIGWDLVLEYAVGASTVAHGWSHYFQDFLKLITNGAITWPAVFGNSPIEYKLEAGHFVSSGAFLDLPALIITAIITTILVMGIKESARFNAIMVAIKIGVVFFVILVGAYYIVPANWFDNFAPFGYGGLHIPGIVEGTVNPATHKPAGVLAGAATIFFAYIGFDAVSTQAEEAKNPGRDIPIGIIASLVICTILYIVVAGVLTGMIPYHKINLDAPVSDAFAQKGITWAAVLISAGAVAGITSVLLVMMMSMPRVFLAMARDGLIPEKFFGDIHHKFRTPWKSTMLTGLIVAAAASLLPLDILADMTNIGTLLAFVIVSAAVLIMRISQPNAERPFKLPFGYTIPILGILSCLTLMLSLGTENWLRLIIWLAIGFVIYFGYSRSHSYLGRQMRGEKVERKLPAAGKFGH